MLAAVMAFLGRDSLAATVLGLFATSWLAQGILDVTGSPGATSDAVGVFLLGFSVAIGGAALIAASGKPLFAFVLALSTTRSVLAGVYQLLGGDGLELAAGVATLALAVAATYTGLALLLEDSRSREVVPVLRRGPARAATEGGAREQVEGIESEPGVREQL